MRTNGWPAALACAALALWPARLASPPLPTPVPERAALDPAGLALAEPDLLGPALAVPLGPGLEETAPAAVSSAPPVDLAPPASTFALGAATTVPEPGWLALLSLASAAGVCRGTRRSLPPHRRR
jgi:hypothetical protein